MTSPAHNAKVRGWLWRGLSVLSLAAAAAGVVTSQAWRPDVDLLLRPPYEVPAIASVLPDPEELTAATGFPFFAISAGPPQVELFESASLFVGEIRKSTVRGGWELEAITPDQRAWFRSTATEANWTTFAESIQSACDSSLPGIDISVPVSIATQNTVNGATALCAGFVRGTTYVSLEAVFRTSTDDPARTPSTLRETFDHLVTAVYARTPSAEVAAPASVPLDATRTLILKGWLIALLALALINTVPPVLLDRSTWERLASRFRRWLGRVQPQIDVEPSSAPIAARTASLALARFAVLVWALRATEELSLGAWGSFGVIIGAFATTVLLERLLFGRGLRILGAPRVTALGLAIVILGLLLTIGVVAVALLLFDGGAAAIASGWYPGLNVWQAALAGNAIVWAAAGVLLCSFFPLAMSRRLAARFRRENPNDDEHPPVLLLRSFGDDGLRMRSRRADRRGLVDQLVLRRWERFEEVLTTALARYGPVITVGSPGETLLPELGAARFSFTNAEWQQQVVKLTDRAAVIAMTIGRTPSLAWEMGRLRDNGLLHKTVFIVPPTSLKERRRRLAVLADSLDIPWAWFELWGTARTPLVVCVPLGTGRPVVLVARGPDDISYEFAIAAAADLITNASPDDDDGFGESAPVSGHREGPAVEMLELGGIARSQAVRRSLAKFGRSLIFPSLVAAVGAIVGAILLSDGSLDDRRVIPVGDGVETTAIAGTYEGRIVAIADGVVFMASPDEGVSVICELDDSVTAAVLGERNVYYLEFDAATVGALDVTTGETLWESPVPPGTRALALAGESVVVASPATGEVISLAADDGRVERRATVGGTPWDVQPLAAGVIVVALIDDDSVVSLRLADLSEIARVSTVAAPREIAALNGGVFVSSSTENVIALVGAEDQWTVGSRTRIPAIATGAGFLAIEAPESISVFNVDRLAGEWEKFAKSSGPIDAMRIEGGMLIVAQGGVIWTVALT